jgi:hypothetical protein
MDWAYLRLGRDEHAFICGLTGSGKSELAQHLVNDPFKRYSVVYDPKHSPTVGRWQGQTFIYSWQELIRSEERRIVYRPSKKAYESEGKLVDETEDPKRQDEFFAFIFDRGHTRVVVDECSTLVGGSRPSYHARKCWTQGRELGLSCVGLTQRPVDVPLILMSEARKIFMFRLNMDEDMQRLRKITGFSEDQQRSLREFEFLMWDYKYGRYPHPIKLDLSRIPQPPIDERRTAHASSGSSARAGASTIAAIS